MMVAEGLDAGIAIIQIATFGTVAVAVIVAAIFNARHKTSLNAAQQAANSWESEARAANQEVARLEEKVVQLTAENLELRSKPDVTSLMRALTDHDARSLEVSGALNETLSQMSQSIKEMTSVIREVSKS